jgi:hypothetical protein
MFSTTCKDCGAEDTLYIVACSAQFVGVQLTADGFSLGDAKQVNTDNEIVSCYDCQAEYPLADLPDAEDDDEEGN